VVAAVAAGTDAGAPAGELHAGLAVQRLQKNSGTLPAGSLGAVRPRAATPCEGATSRFSAA
jgi:hypothetical protein